MFFTEVFGAASFGSGLSTVVRQPKVNHIVDMDGTICTDIPNEHSELFASAEVLEGAVEKINSFYENGDTVTFFTAREEKDREVTEKWLKEKGFKYHSLIMNKPRGGNYKYYDNLKGEFIHFKGDWSKIN